MIFNKKQFGKFQNEEIVINEENKNNLNSNNSQINPIYNSYNYRNIGKNIVLCNKYVFGIKENLCLFISTFIAIGLTFICWILSNNYFYSFFVYIFGTILFVLTQLNFLLCFFTEPGIIPRNDPNYQEKNERTEMILINHINKNNDSNLNHEKDKNLNNNENNNKKEIEKDQIKNSDDLNSIPTIYTERKCETCGIIRPPCSSHCRLCDNCVEEFDHHCFFISNCVGKRNHKYFYLFLFFGSILSIYILIFDLILIIYTFIINSQGIWKILYTNDKTMFIMVIILISLCLICIMFGFINPYILYTTFFIGLALFLYIFYKNKPSDFEKFRNPFTILVLIVISFLCIFATSNCVKQTKNIAAGITIKQDASIKKEIINNLSKNKNININIDKYVKKTKKEKIKNIFKFLFKKIDASLIIPKRDLIIRK